MKFVSIFKFDPSATTEGPSECEMAAMGALIGEMRAAGVLVDTGGVMPTSVSMRVRRDGAQTTVTDGPFTESKEVVGGFAVLDVASKDEALAWTRRFLDCVGNGVTELFEVSTVP
jgi:hypothetical protein